MEQFSYLSSSSLLNAAFDFGESSYPLYGRGFVAMFVNEITGIVDQDIYYINDESLAQFVADTEHDSTLPDGFFEELARKMEIYNPELEVILAMFGKSASTISTLSRVQEGDPRWN